MSPGSAPSQPVDWNRLLGLPGVLEAAAAARSAVDRVLTSRAVLSRQTQVAGEGARRAGRASAALEDPEALDQEGPVLAGALRVYADLPRLRSVWRSSPRQALARLHVLAAADLTDTEQLGRPVDTAAAQVLGSLATLALAPTAAPAVLVAAVVHGDLQAASPFSAGTGVVARAAARLVLAARGLDPGLLCVPEVGQRELDYAQVLAAYRTGQPHGEADWLRHCCRALELGAQESLAIAEALARG